MGVVGLSLVFLTVGKGGLWDLLLDRVDLDPFELWDVSNPHNGGGGIPCNRELFSLFICCSDAWLLCAAASSAARSSSTLLRLCLALFGGIGEGDELASLLDSVLLCLNWHLPLPPQYICLHVTKCCLREWQSLSP